MKLFFANTSGRYVQITDFVHSDRNVDFLSQDRGGGGEMKHSLEPPSIAILVINISIYRIQLVSFTKNILDFTIIFSSVSDRILFAELYYFHVSIPKYFL